MKFYNIQMERDPSFRYVSWTSEETRIRNDINKLLSQGQKCTLAFQDMTEFSGTPSLDSFAHWQYDSVSTFVLCLDRSMFQLYSRGILAEIVVAPSITYNFTALASYGLFGTITREPGKEIQVESLNDALNAVERGISIHLKQLQNQINSLIDTSGNMYI